MIDQAQFDNMTMAQFKAFAHAIPGGESALSFLTCNSYDSFIENLYKAIDKVVRRLEDSRHLMQNDCEDRINIEIINTLSCMGYTALHDPQLGGHCDLYVAYKDYQWIGEAKIYKDYNYLNDGFLQLSTRYTTGTKDQSQGGLIIYIKSRDAATIMQNWKIRFEELNRDSSISFEDDAKKSIGFFSCHKHKTSGDLYKTRHIPVLLYFKPEDRSARELDKRKQKKKTTA